MRFSKYHGIGNDFILVADPDDRVSLTAEQVRAMCDRRFGIGADGVLRVAPGEGDADLFMDYSNSDGSIGEMCGNGIRCLAVFAREEGLIDEDVIKVGTRAGTMVVEIRPDGLVRVDMGSPVFSPEAVPVTIEGPDALHVKLEVDGGFAEAACVSMGNPHAVFFVEDPDEVAVSEVGPRIENLDIFPNRTNVEFATVESAERVRMRVWERGSGETLACGTGACAVAVAARLLHDTGEEVTVALPGGELRVEWSGTLADPGTVFLTGPAVKSFDGEISL